ncbi:MAG TPA: hypothetical protein VM580_22065 [Labilithrix sp.]|nr:hypothetical protein [Labilithrix sp.]
MPEPCGWSDEDFEAGSLSSWTVDGLHSMSIVSSGGANGTSSYAQLTGGGTGYHMVGERLVERRPISIEVANGNVLQDAIA